MRRRQFITLLSGAAAWPFGTRAQQPAMPIIGFLGTAQPSTQGQWVTAFVQRLRELGWIEGRNIAIEYRWGEGSTERFAKIAAEFVHLKVAVIVTGGSALLEAKQATSAIPIVFALAVDPLDTGAVASLARPGGNVTGLSLQQHDTIGKRLELLREVLPGIHRLAVLANVDYAAAVLEMGDVQAMARALGLDVAASPIQRADDIALAIDALKGRADALYVCGDALMDSNSNRLAALVLGARLPTIHNLRKYVEAGGLMSYGPNVPDLFRRAAEIVDKILRGTKPANIPVEQPIKFDLVINLKTAKALGLDVPSTLLARADEVIE